MQERKSQIKKGKINALESFLKVGPWRNSKNWEGASPALGHSTGNSEIQSPRPGGKVQKKLDLTQSPDFTTLTEAKVLIEEWRKEYNQVRPHSALDYRQPAPEAIDPLTLT